MNPYTAQVIGQTGGQFLRSRGKDAQRERMLRLIQLDNEQKKLASFLQEQKRQQEARDAAAQAAQDKIQQQNQIRDAQEKMRLEVLQRLTPTETVAGPMAAIPGALAALEAAARERAGIPRDGMPEQGEEWRARWTPEGEEGPRPDGMIGPPMSKPELSEAVPAIPPMPETPTPLSMIGRKEAQAVEKDMDPDMAAFYRSEMQGAQPGDVDIVAKDIRKEMFKAPPKDKKPSFIKTWFKPDERPDTRKAGGFDIVYPAQNIDNETLKFFARQDGIDLTDEEIDQLHASINIRGSAGVTQLPSTEGQQFTPAPGMTMREWDGNGPPPLPGMSLPPGVEPGSPAAQEFQYEAGRAAEKTKKTKSESAQTAAQFILEGIGDRERINRYTQLKGDPEKWAALPIETQAAIEAKVSVLRNREAQKANKPKGKAEKTMTEKEYWYNKRQLTKRQQAMANRTKDASGQWVVEWENTYIPQADFVAESQSIRAKIEEYEAKKSGKPAPKKGVPKLRPVDPDGMAQDDLQVLP